VVPRKLIVHLLRLLPLMLVPILLAPVLVFALQRSSGSELYQSVATIWVQDSELIQQPSLTVQNAFLTPAQRQVSVVRDLLMTESFRMQMAEEAGLIRVPEEFEADPGGGSTIGPAPTPPSAASFLTASQRGRVSTVIGRSVAVNDSGANLMVITATSPNPETAQALAQAVISVYDARLRMESDRQYTITLEYLTSQLAAANSELATRRADLERYVASRPNVNLAEVGDLEYRTLASYVDAQMSIVNSLNQAVQSNNLTAVSASQGLAARFNVLDSPAQPDQPLEQSRIQVLGMPVAAMVMMLLLAAGYLLVVYRTDHSVLSAEDLSDLDVPFLGYAPRLQRDRPRWRPHWSMRRNRSHARQTAASFAVREAA